MEKKKSAHSKTVLGTFNHELLLARTGKKAPEVDPTRTMKIEATRNPK
jgi:hypothetical protein